MNNLDLEQVEIKPLVYFIGLSAKQNCKPLDKNTKTGFIVDEIIYRLPYVFAIKTNLVNAPPLTENGKLRYPNLDEMTLGWNQLQTEINLNKPALLVILGQQVSLFLRAQMGIQPIRPMLPANFAAQDYITQASQFLLSVHHPSYVYVYHRSEINNYIENVVASVSSLLFNNNYLSLSNQVYLN